MFVVQVVVRGHVCESVCVRKKERIREGRKNGRKFRGGWVNERQRLEERNKRGKKRRKKRSTVRVCTIGEENLRKEKKEG